MKKKQISGHLRLLTTIWFWGRLNRPIETIGSQTERKRLRGEIRRDNAADCSPEEQVGVPERRLRWYMQRIFSNEYWVYMTKLFV